MACETMLKPRQTLQQRKDEVRVRVVAIEKKLARRLVRVVVGRNGAVTFTGIATEDRDGLTDACIYRRIMATGSALARSEIARAEQMAGRTVDRNVIGSGVHSHDGGQSWDRH